MSRYNPKTHCHPYLANWLVILRFMRHYSIMPDLKSMQGLLKTRQANSEIQT